MMRRLFGWYALPMKIMSRPFAGFYEMKFEGKGTMRLAMFNFLLVCIAFAFQTQYAAILVNQSHPASMNTLRDTMFVAATLLLFCVANWSVTSLTDGEGRLKDIFMAVCYAMTPIIFTVIPATILSNMLAGEETGIYFLILSLGTAYFVLLVFVGLITVHNYGAIKAVLTLLLTFVAILIIVFLVTLLFTLWTQLYAFAYSVYTELMFRG
jgi:hypothetical protein